MLPFQGVTGLFGGTRLSERQKYILAQGNALRTKKKYNNALKGQHIIAQATPCAIAMYCIFNSMCSTL